MKYLAAKATEQKKKKNLIIYSYNRSIHENQNLSLIKIETTKMLEQQYESQNQ